MSSKEIWHTYKTKLSYMTWDLSKFILIRKCLWFRILSQRHFLFLTSWGRNYILQGDPPGCSPASENNISHCYRSTFVWDLLRYIQLQGLGCFFPELCHYNAGFHHIQFFSLCSSIKIHRLMLNSYGKKKFGMEFITQSTDEWQKIHIIMGKKEGIRNIVLLESWVYSERLKFSLELLVFGTCICHL